MITQCLADRGSGDRCGICPLARAGKCALVMERLDKAVARLRVRDFRLAEADRQTILRETLYAVIQRVEEALNSNWDIENIGLLTSAIFRNKRAGVYGAMPRFGEQTTVRITAEPAGLPALLRRFSAQLSYDNSRLSCGPSLPREVYRALLALADDAPWRRAIELLYANSWKGQLLNLEDFTATLAGHDHPDADKGKDDGGQYLLAPYLAIWKRMGSRQASSCGDLFARFGAAIFEDTGSSRDDIARSLGVKTNSLTKKISRCYGLLHEFFIRTFIEIQETDSSACAALFEELYGQGAKHGKKGMVQKISKAAGNRGVSTREINAMIRRCRKLVLCRLGLGQRKEND